MDKKNGTDTDREVRASLIAAALHDESGTIEQVMVRIKERFGLEPHELYLRVLVHLQWIGRKQGWDVSNQPNWPDLLRILANEFEGRGKEDDQGTVC